VRYDVVVLDPGLPDGDGTDLITERREANPRVVVLVLSASLDPKPLERATEAGAEEMLDKFTIPGEVLSAIRRTGTGAAADTV
jgi:DNA-binding response OmpR family regulator